MDPNVLHERDPFLDLVIEKLGRTPIDFVERLAAIRSEAGERRDDHLAAGVLLLIHFKAGEFFFQLIKRSARVTQPGDLSCPGGMLHPFTDPPLKALVKAGWPPIMKGRPKAEARLRGEETYDLIALFLANAVRESWEEVGLNPFNIQFLGPLPTYSLILFRRTIFPLVGFVKRPWRFQTNDEVEQVVEIPLRAFFLESNFRRYTIEYAESMGLYSGPIPDFPCLIQENADGRLNILWGATFFIIVNFLKIILDYQLPDWQRQEAITKVLRADYLTGNPS